MAAMSVYSTQGDHSKSSKSAKWVISQAVRLTRLRNGRCISRWIGAFDVGLVRLTLGWRVWRWVGAFRVEWTHYYPIFSNIYIYIYIYIYIHILLQVH